MRITIDGEKVPVNVRVSRDLLITLKSMAKTLRWKIRYDAANEIVHLFSSSADISSDISLPSFVETESNRLAGKIICLDPGHGGSAPGATGPTQTLEKDNTLAIALLVRDKLESNGATVIMTRDTDRNVAVSDAAASEDLETRVAIANEAGVDIFVSIHNDAFTSDTEAGTTTFHYGDCESIALAGCIQKCLVEQLSTKDRGVRFASFYIIRYTNMPAVLTEVAFISNPEEELLLASMDGRSKAADSIFQGITKYFKV
ncbi:MAG: N-acetylmuramoyl-L-alanine amidase [Veillonellales bacterium]